MDDQTTSTPSPHENPVFMPSSVLNFFISLIPGAGQMYQGLLQRGVTLMACFTAFITLTIFFGGLMYGVMRNLLIGIGVTGIVITYFYSFFDSLRTCRLMRAGIQTQDYLGVLDQPFTIHAPKAAGNGRIILGVVLVVIGALSLISRLMNLYFSADFIRQYLRPALEALIPLAFLVVGMILLLKGRKARKGSV